MGAYRHYAAAFITRLEGVRQYAWLQKIPVAAKHTMEVETNWKGNGPYFATTLC